MKLLKRYTIVVPAMLLMVGGVLASVAPKQQQAGYPMFSKYAAGHERKAAFFGYFLPLVKARNSEIVKTREQLQSWYRERDNLDSHALRRLQQLAKEYRLGDFDASNELKWKALLRRVDVLPPSLALAQAANESAWGTSRFAREANNYYGQWCFSKGCGLVPKQRSAGKSHEVAKFSSPTESVDSYIRNLNRNRAYTRLRKIRERMRAANKPIHGAELAKGLGSYSARGTAYIKELQAMIRQNKLQRYD